MVMDGMKLRWLPMHVPLSTKLGIGSTFTPDTRTQSVTQAEQTSYQAYTTIQGLSEWRMGGGAQDYEAAYLRSPAAPYAAPRAQTGETSTCDSPGRTA